MTNILATAIMAAVVSVAVIFFRWLIKWVGITAEVDDMCEWTYKGGFVRFSGCRKRYSIGGDPYIYCPNCGKRIRFKM